MRKLLSGIASIFVSLIVFALIFGVIESALRIVPSSWLPAEVVTVPPLYKEYRPTSVFEKGGFRGQKMCSDCGDSVHRILMMGGSSTNGIPMFYSARTYPAQLQRLLNERIPSRDFEVLNAGVGGWGIMQVLQSLREGLLDTNPDVVTINCWFNDSSYGPGPNAVFGQSDKDGYDELQRLKKLSEIPGYEKLRNTKTFATLRWLILSLRDSSKSESAETGASSAKGKKAVAKIRMTPDEFRWALTEIITMSEEKSFLPIFVFEPLNRTFPTEMALEKNAYYRVIKELSEEHSVALVSPLDSLNEKNDSWLFYDFIHPNPEGYRIIAEELYQTMFGTSQTALVADFWKKKGIEPNPNARKNFYLKLDTSKYTANRSREIVVEAHTPYAHGSTMRPLRLKADVSGFQTFDLGQLSKDPKTFSFSIPESALSLPIVDVDFRSEFDDSSSVGLEVGSTGAALKKILKVKSGGRDSGWTVGIWLDGERLDFDYRGYNVAIIGAVSGNVLGRRFFDTYGAKSDAIALYNYLNNLGSFYEQGQAPIVVMAVKTDGFAHLEVRDFSNLFKSLGGTGNLPDSLDSMIFVGVPGAEVGTAVEQYAKELLTFTLGREGQAGADLFVLEPRDLSLWW